MAKVTNKNSYDSVVELLKNEQTKKIKKSKNKNHLMSQEEVFAFLDKKKVLISEEGADELLGILIKEKIISEDIDEGDFDDVEDDFGEPTEVIKLNSFDDTQEISLNNITDTQEIDDKQLKNKLTETDDIVK